MKLPKKISPDNIKESVVELKYISELPFEILLGLFFNALDDSYKYTNRSQTSPAIISKENESQSQDLEIKIGNTTLFYNSKVTIQVLSNTFVFTCIEKYIGWEDFRIEIQNFLKQINKTGHIKTWIRVGMRYISEYPEKDLKELIKFSFSFGLPMVKSLTSAFRTQFEYKNLYIILNLSNLTPTLKQTTSKDFQQIKLSVVDIDVISQNEILVLPELFKKIDENHNIEKEVFFNMLNQTFLESLNPKY